MYRDIIIFSVGSNVARSVLVGNARASWSGTSNNTVPALFFVYICLFLTNAYLGNREGRKTNNIKSCARHVSVYSTMKHFIKLFLALIFGSLVFVACQSDADALKDATVKINELTDKMENATDVTEMQALAVKYEKVINSIPEKIRNMSDEEVLQIEGSEDFIAAAARFSAVSVEAQGRLLENAGNAFSGMYNSLNSFVDKISESDDE